MRLCLPVGSGIYLRGPHFPPLEFRPRHIASSLCSPLHKRKKGREEAGSPGQAGRVDVPLPRGPRTPVGRRRAGRGVAATTSSRLLPVTICLRGWCTPPPPTLPRSPPCENSECHQHGWAPRDLLLHSSLLPTAVPRILLLAFLKCTLQIFVTLETQKVVL